MNTHLNPHAKEFTLLINNNRPEFNTDIDVQVNYNEENHHESNIKVNAMKNESTTITKKNRFSQQQKSEVMKCTNICNVLQDDDEVV